MVRECQGRTGRRACGALLAVLVLAAGCSAEDTTKTIAPPRITAPATLPQQQSVVVVPIRVPLADITAAAERAIPKDLWKIEKSGVNCIKAARLKLGDKRLKITPDFKCTIVGEVRRGPVKLSGKGKTLRLTMPIEADLGAKNVLGVIKETAHAKAVMTADMTFSVTGDWKPGGTVRVAYDWKDAPHIDFLGQRIELASKADPKLKELIAKAERKLPAELAKVQLKDRVEAGWKAAFTVISVNAKNPPVWMRVTPGVLGYEGYRVDGRDLELTLSLAALTEGFVGDRPADPTPTPLPPPGDPGKGTGITFHLPVLANPQALEPVILKALNKLNAKGIVLPALGKVDAKFLKATAYPTEGGRVAVGVEAEVRLAESRRDPVRGIVWLSAVPQNAPDSTRIEWRDVQMAARTDARGVNLLISLFESESVREEIRTALALNLQKDYDKLLVKVRAAVAEKQLGKFRLTTTIDAVRHGEIAVTGAGLFLPVRAEGKAVLRYSPQARTSRAAAAKGK